MINRSSIRLKTNAQKKINPQDQSVSPRLFTPLMDATNSARKRKTPAFSENNQNPLQQSDRQNKTRDNHTSGHHDKENQSPPATRPLNLYGRQHTPTKAACLMVDNNPDGSFTVTQPINTKNSFYTALDITLNLEKKIEADSNPLLLSPAKSRANPAITAKSPGGTEFGSSRHVTVKIDGKTQKILLLSPLRNDDNDAVHKVRKNRKRAKFSLKSKSKKGQSLNNRLIPPSDSDDESEHQTDIMGNKQFMLSDFKRRRTESSTQNEVTKRSARDELRNFINQKKEQIEATTLMIMESLIEKNYALEWLHCLAYSLAPKDFEPQSLDNLAVGPKWINSYMMVMEKVAYHFKNIYPNAVSVTPTFTLVENSKIIKNISYSVKLNVNGMELELEDHVTALSLPNRSNFPSASDQSQIIKLLNKLLDPEYDDVVMKTTVIPAAKP